MPPTWPLLSEQALAEVAAAVEGVGEVDLGSWSCDLPLADALLLEVALRHVVRWRRAHPEAPVPPLLGLLDPAPMRWAEAIVREAVGPQAPCGPLHPESWPPWISDSHSAAHHHRASGRPYAAAMHLRDTAEAVMRLAWLVVVHRAWTVARHLEGRPERAHERAAIALLGTVRCHPFSFGRALKAVAAYAPGLAADPAGPPLPVVDGSWARDMRAFVDWRNHGAHGPAPTEAEALADVERNTCRLTGLLARLDPWLCAVHAAWGLPEASLEPVLWVDPSGDLWALEQIGRDHLLMRALSSGATRTLDGHRGVGRMLDWIEDGPTLPREPIDLTTTVRPDGLLTTTRRALDARGFVEVSGPIGSGVSTLIEWLGHDLTADDWVVIRFVVDPARPAPSTEDLRDDLLRQARTLGLTPPSELGQDARPPLDRDGLAAWWHHTLGGRRAVVLIDGFSDPRPVAGWLEATAAPRVVAGDVPRRWPAGPPARIQIDAWVATPDGRAWLEQVARRHGHHGATARLVERSLGRARRVAWLARQHASLDTWPDEDPGRWYGGVVRALEDHYAGHVGLQRCLRHALLSVALGPDPLPDSVLQTSSLPDASEWLEWLPTILRGPQPLLDRIPVDRRGLPTSGVADDDEPTAWRLADRWFADWLRSGDLPPEWAATRAALSR